MQNTLLCLSLSRGTGDTPSCGRDGVPYPGERVLVHAAAGGIGHFAVQLARAMEAGQIIATASSAAKLEVAQSLGADTLINYTEPDWTEQVMQATEGKGVDVILDIAHLCARRRCGSASLA
jgi:NADPH:quinone reductase-like Zn-dependent oxidoreductase